MINLIPPENTRQGLNLNKRKATGARFTRNVGGVAVLLLQDIYTVENIVVKQEV